MSYKPLDRNAVEKRANEIVKTMGARCQYGGCSNHGQEFCNLDAAWERAVSRAEDELDAERDAAEDKS